MTVTPVFGVLRQVSKVKPPSKILSQNLNTRFTSGRNQLETLNITNTNDQMHTFLPWDIGAHNSAQF